jgi:phosphoribosyl 1,2-cyclic phosphate phosphodiesterase
MNLLFLGTGTSSGVPLIGCDCAVCRSSDPRNRRRRASVYVVGGGVHVLVDAPPDFREQALAYRLPRVDAVLFTHSHADHVFGFDDLRRYNTMQGTVIPAYADPDTVEDLKRMFPYIAQTTKPGLYRPLIKYHPVRGRFRIGGLDILPLPVFHDGKSTVGYLFREGARRVGYIPDCLTIEEEVLGQVHGVDVMVLDALRHRPHRTHLTVSASIALLHRIGAGRGYLTHVGHEVEHAATQRDLPPGVHLAYDGLSVDV